MNSNLWIVSNLKAYAVTFLIGLFAGFVLGLHPVRADIGPWALGALALVALAGSWRDGSLRGARAEQSPAPSATARPEPVEGPRAAHTNPQRWTMRKRRLCRSAMARAKRVPPSQRRSRHSTMTRMPLLLSEPSCGRATDDNRTLGGSFLQRLRNRGSASPQTRENREATPCTTATIPVLRRSIASSRRSVSSFALSSAARRCDISALARACSAASARIKEVASAMLALCA